MIRKEIPWSLVLSSALAGLLSYFEYYYVTLDGVPYREIGHSTVLGMPPYVLFPLLPLIALVTFLPILDNLLLHRNDLSHLNRRIAISLANFLCAITIYDAAYYALRLYAPMSTDPLAGLWITAGEDSFLGLVNLFGVLIPTWYFATIPILLSIYVAYYIS